MNKHVLQLSEDNIRKFYPHAKDQCPAKPYMTIHAGNNTDPKTLKALGKMAKLAINAIEKGKISTLKSVA